VIVMKVLAARPKDTEDVVAILASQPDSLDLVRVRRLLSDLEAALGQSDLMPVLDGALARIQHER
jgi:hypothetical protein